MKLKRIAAMPFALVADVVTLGNMGGESFTEKLFNDERREREAKQVADLAAKLARAQVALRTAEVLRLARPIIHAPWRQWADSHAQAIREAKEAA